MIDTVAVAEAEDKTDVTAQWRLLGAALEESNQNKLLQECSESMFTGERLRVYNVFVTCIAEDHGISYDGVLRRLGYYPASVEAAQGAPWKPAFEHARLLSLRRQAREINDATTRLLREPVFDEAAFARVMDYRPVLNRLQSSSEPYYNAFMRDLLKKMNDEWVFLKTGLSDLDDALGGGLPEREIVIVSGNSGAGKSTAKLNIVEALLDQNVGTMIVEYDMPAQENMLRFAAWRAGISSTHIRSGRVSTKEYAQIDEELKRLVKQPLYMLDCAGTSFSQLLAEIRLHAEKYNVRVVFIDHLQAMSLPEGFERSVTEGFNRALVALKAIANKYNLSIVGLSQLNKEGTEFNSSYIRQIAHAIMQVGIDKENAYQTQGADGSISYRAPYHIRFTKNRGGPAAQITDKYVSDGATYRILERLE